MPVLLLVATYLALIVALVWGWVLNVIGLIGMLDGAITALFLARVVGVFVAPLGAVLGFFA